ncbi:MAG: alpha-amylase family glycosyl hydrolase, partial [Chitinispirillia bacterium]
MSNGIKELATVDLNEIVSNKGEYHPSPVKWEDQVLYFLMLDRFSDNSERDYKDNENNIEYNGETPPYSLDQDGNALVNAEQWREAGNKWCGGNLKGLCSKIGYLKRLGITAIWISPVLKQVDIYNTYHGYGTQNFLDIDGNFGTKEDFIELVKEAHNNKIYVILDIILNHTGDVFEYKNGNRCYENDIQFPVENYRDANGDLLIPFSKNVSDEYFPEGAIWPKELQDPQTFSRKGEISDWNAYPETLNGDFPHPEGLYELRDIKLGEGSIECYSRSESLKYLCKIYSYWIAYTDIDGIRLDTVKHMDEGATRFFCSVIHEFAQSIGKVNFYLISEDTDGRETAFKR